MSRKDREREMNYETPEVQFETPVKKAKPAKPSNTFEHDCGCWCGKQNLMGCTGNPTQVVKVERNVWQFVCPYGRDKTSSIPAKLFEAAKRAGLVSQEEDSNG